MPQPARPVTKVLVDRVIDAYNLRYGSTHPYFADSTFVPYLGTSQGVKYNIINTQDPNPPVANTPMWMYGSVFFTYCPGIYESIVSPVLRYSSIEREFHVMVGRKHMFDVQRELALPAI